MTDYKTMRVPEDAWEDAQEERQRLGLTWGEYLLLPVNGNVTDVTEPHDAELAELVDRNYEAIKEATNAAQNAERATEELQR